MKSLAFFLMTAALLAQSSSRNPFLGRWDITVTTQQGATYPDWLEVTGDGALIQPRSGGARKASDVKVEGSRLTLTQSQGTSWDVTASSDRIGGTIKRGDAVIGQLAGVRAPKLDRPMPKAWTEPESLFNGKDLAGWEPMTPNNNHWVAKNGELVNEDHGANLKSTRKFDDFKLHLEFNCPDKGNSGIYLRGRYEVQIEYEPEGTEDRYHMMGAVYSFVAPTADVPRKPGQWESFDITLVGRRVTIVRDGVKTVDNQEIPGITGGALDANEGEPGPFYIQGDHTGGMRFRNIAISVPKK